MVIKETDDKFKKYFSRYKNVKKKWIVLVAIVLLYSVVVFITGALAHRTGVKQGLRWRDIALFDYRSLFIYLTPRGLIADPVKSIAIDIKFKDFQKLQYERKIAISKHQLVSDEYVPAAIQYKNKEYDVKLRLKGDHIDHLIGKKWSYRVIVKGDNTIFGMKQFSIHHPKTRNFIYEWIFHRILKRENIISLRYDFIDVVLNGEDLGIYAIEEHFEKRLIEHNQRKEGLVLRFNESYFWDQMQASHEFPTTGELSGYGSYLSSNIDAFQTDKIFDDETMFNNHAKAVSLLESFRNDELSTTDVFDVEKLSSFFAITDILGAEHGSRWHNARFYYNPIASRLEPIGFDANIGSPINSLVGVLEDIRRTKSYYSMIFKDKLFYYKYIKKLEKYAEKSYIDSIFAEINNELEKKIDILASEWPWFTFDEEVMQQNLSYIRKILDPPKAIHPYLMGKNENRIELAFGNIQRLPVEIISVTINDTVNILPQEEIILPGKFISEPVEYHNYIFTIPKDVELTDKSLESLKVNHKIYGTSKLNTIEVFPWEYLDRDLMNNDFVRKPSNVSDFDFIFIDEANKLIKFKQGAWEIAQNIHIPEGYKVYISEGTELNLINSASLISYSPLIFTGSDEYPISIRSSDSTGQGIFVLNTNEESVLEHVQFENLSSPSKNGWELSGAITFYEADVSIAHCIFSNNRKGDDYLNIIRSKFQINNTLFSDILSDAFDSDFSQGTITDSSFVNCGNDAIDTSGANITLKNIFMDNIGDKGLSAGESSRLIANNINIKNSEIAVCSKDMSEIALSDVSLIDNKIGFAVFQKKSEFGPGKINAANVILENITIPYLIEEQSTCTIDGEMKMSSNVNVKDILYGVKYGRSSE